MAGTLSATFGAVFGTLRVDDPEERLAGVRLRSDLPLPDPDFAREDGGWVLHLPDSGLGRLEYQLELCDHDGDTVVVCDPGNPERAPGAFGDKSVLLAPGYRPPAWLEQPRRARRARAGDDPRARPRPRSRRVVAGEGELPLLVAHDGPEYDELAALTRYAGAMIERRSGPALPGRAAAARRSRRVVLGLGGLRPRAVQPDPAQRCASTSRSTGQPVGHGREPRRPGDAPGAADVARRVRRPVPAVGELLRAPLRPTRVRVSALRPDRAVRPSRAAHGDVRRADAGVDDLRRRGGERLQQPPDGERAHRSGLRRAIGRGARPPQLHVLAGRAAIRT